jgi:alpha-mannosidase
LNSREIDIYVKRIDNFINRLSRQILGEFVVFDASYAISTPPVPFENRLDLKYDVIQEGQNWGEAWDSAWFNLEAKIPQSWQGQNIAANLDFSGEGLVYSHEGEILQGITNGSVFDGEFSRDIVRLMNKCKGGEKIHLDVEAVANGLFGVITEPDPDEDSPDRYGHFEAIVNKMRLCVFHDKIWHLWLDLKILQGLIKTLPKNSVRRARIISTVNKSIDIFAENPDNTDKCSHALKKELDKPASASDLSVLAVGHAHIDTAWLWPIRETIRKCARTFSSQIALIEKYPDYVFGASQPQHYAFVKKHYPELYEKIKKAVAQGKWEPQGGMWVEADCNLISGESMVRQFLYGKNFFKDEFGIDVKNLWLPDVFGYSAAMPQIMKKAGVEFFLTQKLSWNQFNEFPHHTFKWRGIDGSEVLAHFPPENTYNSQLGTDYLVPAQENFKEKDFIDQFISLFGVGDGGGGPKEENIELGRRMANLEGSPKVEFGRAEAFFERLKKYNDDLHTWVGELYLELHRGTLTTQARTKKANRRLENKLRLAEILWSCLPIDKYPGSDLQNAWQKALMLQFHDILPGSSITKVYDEAHADHQRLLEECDDLIRMATTCLSKPEPDSILLFNPTPYRFEGPIEIPYNGHGESVIDENSHELPVQRGDDILLVDVSLEPYSFLNLRRFEKKISISHEDNHLVLENDLIFYEFEENGAIIRAFDKDCEQEIIAEDKKGNSLTLYADHPNNWDAWDIDLFYENNIVDTAHPVSITDLESGKLRRGIRFELKIGISRIVQKAYLTHNSKRLDFETTVEWKEKHKMLRVSFPVNVSSDQAAFDIQYGYVMRPTHRNTSWDVARFEVPAHRYADLSDLDYGVALLNDCKYGYKAHDNVIDLNLLRSPTAPDPDADQGYHEFTYSLLPHRGDLIHSEVIKQAAQLNRKIFVSTGLRSKLGRLPWRIVGDGLALEVVKKAEKEDCLILRMVETLGRHSEGWLEIDDSGAVLVETDLMECTEGKTISCDKPVRLSLKPFEIRTYKLKAEKNV